MPRLLVVDDHPPVGDGLKRTLAPVWEVEVALSLTSARVMLAQKGPWRAVLLDVHLGDGNGLDLLEWAKPQLPGTFWVVVTNDGDRRLVQRATELGAAFVPKPFRAATLQAWLDGLPEEGPKVPEDFILGGDEAGDGRIIIALERFAETYSLTTAETRVLRCAVKGLDRALIAQQLAISVHTYQKHALGVRKKTGSGVPQAAVRVLRWAVLGPET